MQNPCRLKIFGATSKPNQSGPKIESAMESILQQPPEILEMIFDHLDMKTSKEAALACPTFYENVCSSQRNRPHLQLHFLKIGVVEDSTFAQISQLRNLVFLDVSVAGVKDKSSVVLLKNLQNLKKLILSDLI